MNQRIAIETPNGTVYLGEECEARLSDNWSKIRAEVLRFDDGFRICAGGVWIALERIRPVQPKKMRDMYKSELVQLVLKGAEFFRKDGRSVMFPSICAEGDKIIHISGWLMDDFSHYTLPNDPTERKLEVEE